MDLSRSTATAISAEPDADPAMPAPPPWIAGLEGNGVPRRGGRLRFRSHRPRRMRRRDRARLDRELGARALPAPLLTSSMAAASPLADTPPITTAPMATPALNTSATTPMTADFARAAALLESWDADDAPAQPTGSGGPLATSHPIPPDAIDLSDGPRLINRPGMVPAQRQPSDGGSISTPGASPEPKLHDSLDESMAGVDAGLAAAVEAELTAPLRRSPAAQPVPLAVQSQLAEPLIAIMLAITGSVVAWGTVAPASLWLPLITFPVTGLFAIVMPGRDRVRLLRAVAVLAAAAVLPAMSSAMTPVTLIAALTVAATYPLMTRAWAGWLTTGFAMLSLLTPLAIDAVRTGPEAFISTFTTGSSALTAVRVSLAAGVLVVALAGISSIATRRRLAAARPSAQHRVNPPMDAAEVAEPSGQSLALLAPAQDDDTGLPARRAVLRQLSALLSGTNSVLLSAPVGVAMIEVDSFPGITASIGADAADDVATQVGQRLRAGLPSHQLVARMSGHQYAVVIADASEPACTDLISAVSACLQTPVSTAGHADICVTCSIGTAVQSADLSTAAELLEAADEAVRAAQRTGRSRAVMFDQAVRAHAQTQATLEVELREAVSHGTIGALFQPLLALGTGDDDDRIVGAEALAEWTRTDGSVVPPERFLAMADDLGLGRTISLHVLELALDALLAWRAEGVGVDQVWVNLAASQFSEPGLAREISTRLTSRGLNPSCLVIEVAAHNLAENDAALSTLGMLRSLGVAITLDQFGRSGTSLTSLRSLPISAVKVDPRLGAELGTHDAVPRSIVQLCHSLGLQVVVEGIETLAQLHGAREIHADAVQGYAIARPMPAHDVTNLLSLRLPREFRLR